jgi:hypothetical protein
VWGPLVRSLHEIPVRIREALNWVKPAVVPCEPP